MCTVQGKGQVIDCSMVDGASYLSTFMYTSKKLGIWNGERGANLLDSGAPFYDTYVCACKLLCRKFTVFTCMYIVVVCMYIMYK